MKLMPPLSNLEFGELFLLEIIKTSVTLLGVFHAWYASWVQGPQCFWTKDAMGTHLTFSAGVTELGWSYGGDLSPCSIHAAWSSSIKLVYRQREGRGRGDAVGEGRDWELFRACLHLQNKERGWQKDYSGYFLTVEGYVCDVASHCYIHRPVYVPENHSLLPPFFVFLLFCSLASPHSCFLYYFISVSESLSLPPPLSHSSSFFPPSLLLHPFLPPTSHLCMCHFQL